MKYNEFSFYTKPAWDFDKYKEYEILYDEFAKNHIKFHNQQIEILFNNRSNEEIFNKIYNPNYSPELMNKIIKILKTDFLTEEDKNKYINLAIIEN